MPVLPDSGVETQYIRQLGEKLVSTIPSQYPWPFEFHVVAQKEINAFALPGGPMFINLGTITSAANEAQLAGVMAHEMAHVYMQHSAKQASKAQTTDLLAGIAGAVLGAAVGGAVGQLGQMGIQMTAQGLVMKYSRADESQADEVGAIILYKAGYNPQAMADFFRTLESQGGASPPEWLSDHPNPGNRQQAIEKEIKDWPSRTYSTDSAAFQKAKQHAIGVKAYSGEEIAQGAKSGRWAALNRQNGATFGPSIGGTTTPAPVAEVRPVSLASVLPGNRMISTNLGPLRMKYPENWQVVMPKQQGQFVTIAPQAGITTNGVGYGVLLNGVPASSVQRVSIDGVTRQLIDNMQQNNGLHQVSDTKAIRVSGIQGRSVMLQSTSPFPAANGKPQNERDWLVAVPQRHGSVIFMVFVAPQTHFYRFQATFEAMLKSAQF